MIHIDKIAQLIPYKNMFTAGQITKLAEATIKSFYYKPTKKQIGGFLGTLLASIDVSLLLKALTSNCLQGYSRYQPPEEGCNLITRVIWTNSKL